MSRRSRPSANDEVPAGRHVWQSLRKSKVKRARKLVNSKNYPSKKVMASVAKLLAEQLRKKEA